MNYKYKKHKVPLRIKFFKKIKISTLYQYFFTFGLQINTQVQSDSLLIKYCLLAY